MYIVAASPASVVQDNSCRSTTLIGLLPKQNVYGCCFRVFLAQLFFNEIAGFDFSSRPYLLKYGAPCRPDVIVRYLAPFQKKKKQDFFSHSIRPRVEQP